MSPNSDNIDMVYWLYNRTGDPRLLELARNSCATGQSWMDRIGGGHNEQTRTLRFQGLAATCGAGRKGIR